MNMKDVFNLIEVMNCESVMEAILSLNHECLIGTFLIIICSKLIWS